MKRIEVTVYTWYVVEGAAGSTVINPSTGRAVATVEEGKQTAFYALTPYVLVSDDSVTVNKANFKGAPVGLFGSGGGAVASSPLPDDYIEADFIQFDGNDFVQYKQEAVTSKAGDRLVFSTINQFYDFLEDKSQSEGNYSTFCYGVINGNIYYSVGTTAESAAMEADTNWHKIILSHTPSLSFFRVDGAEFPATYNASALVLQYGICVGLALNRSTHYCYSRKRRATLQINGVTKFDLIPAITAAGSVVFYDVANGKNKTSNSNKLRAGLTLSQARKLIKLPDGGGATLRLCLPSNYEEDEYVTAILAELHAKGWIPDIDTYSQGGENVASTFAFKRVLVRKTQDVDGNYVDANGVRYFVEKTQTIIGADPQELGYEPFRSVESAIAYWELEPYVNPEEEILTEPTTNEHE